MFLRRAATGATGRRPDPNQGIACWAEFEYKPDHESENLQRSDGIVKLVAQIPALNEEKSIERVLDAIPRRIPGIDEVVAEVANPQAVEATDATPST